MKHIKTFESFNHFNISEDLKYHMDNNLSLMENVFRSGSDKFFDVINEARELFNSGKISLSKIDEELINSDLGKKGIYEDKDPLPKSIMSGMTQKKKVAGLKHKGSVAPKIKKGKKAEDSDEELSKDKMR